MNYQNFSVIIEQDKDGFFAFSPDLQGCYTAGNTYEEVLENVKDAISLHVKDRVETGERLEKTKSVSLSIVEIAV